MFMITTEIFCESCEETTCFGIYCKESNIHVPCVSTELSIVQTICTKLNNAQTDYINLRYIIEDLICELYIKTA